VKCRVGEVESTNGTASQPSSKGIWHGRMYISWCGTLGTAFSRSRRRNSGSSTQKADIYALVMSAR